MLFGTNQNKFGVVILISEKVDRRVKTITMDEQVHFIMRDE